MRTGEANLGGIGYRLDVHEGMATFMELDRMSCARITVQKCEPHGLLYVQCSSASGFVPFCHVTRAVSVCETLFGPNHYLSLEAMHRHERNIALSHIWKLPVFRPTRRMFWCHDIPFRVASIWRAIGHQFRLMIPRKTPRVKWQEAAA